MITLLQRGQYRLVETKHHTKVLYLDKTAYAWINATHIGEILVASHRLHKTDYILGCGEYRLYDVNDEPHLSDQIHLELEVGRQTWQGYLLLTGLPVAPKKSSRIIPTSETINGRMNGFKLTTPINAVAK